MKRSLVISLVLLAIFSSCNTECDRSQNLIEDPAAYMEAVEQWQEDRLEGLKSKEGWLNLAGI